MSTIRLQSSDGQIFDMDMQVAVKSLGTIKTMLEDCGIESDSDTVVPLPNVRGDILRRVLEYANHHKDDPEPLDDDDKNGTKTTDAWDAKFLKVDQETLLDLMLAANYLHLKGLFNVTCRTVANMIKGKSTEQIREIFHIQNDMSDDEMEQGS